MTDSLISALLSARGIFYIIVFFGGSIFVHELGHFLAAKSRGLKVERFSIGFGPKIFGWRRKETEYRISLLPLGGYVAIPQLADMEMVEGKTENPDSVPAKKLSYLDKVIVFAAGAFFNVLFAVLCAIVLWIAKTPVMEGVSGNVVGNTIPELEISPGKIEVSPAAKAGILPGDRIVEIDGVPVDSFKDITMQIAIGTRRTQDGKPAALLKIRRGENIFDLEVFPELVAYNPRSGDFVRTLGIEPMMPLIVSDRDGTYALPSGFLNGDRIREITLPDNAGTHRVYSLSQFSSLLERSGGKSVTLTVERGSPAKNISVALTPKTVPALRESGKISFEENGQHRELELVPVPDELSDFSPTAQRKNLVVLNALPPDSSLSEICVPGTKIAGISSKDQGIRLISSPKDLENFSGKRQELSLFLDLPGGKQTVVTVKGAAAERIPEKKVLRAGLPLAFPQKYVRETPWAQIADAVELTYSSVVGLLNPKSDIGVSHLNGIFSIADTYYELSFDLRRVLMLTILININLAFLNLLPVPVLDGGHILFATIERVRRKPLPKSVLSAIQTVFVFALLIFMAFILFRDFSRTRGNADLKTLELISEHRFFR